MATCQYCEGEVRLGVNECTCSPALLKLLETYRQERHDIVDDVNAKWAQVSTERDIYKDIVKKVNALDKCPLCQGGWVWRGVQMDKHDGHCPLSSWKLQELLEEQ